MNKIRGNFAVYFIVIGLLSVNVAYAQYGGGRSIHDYSAPTISNVEVVASVTTATITWITDESSISWVVYGTSTSYGLEAKTTTYNTSHSLVLNNLSSATTYHYQVKSKDSAGNIGSYTDGTFTTGGAVAIPATPATPTTPVVSPTLKAMPFPAAITIVEMQANLAVLLENLTALQVYQKAVTAAQAPIAGSIPPAGSYKVGLALGVKGNDVTALQNFLKSQGVGIYPEGLVTGYYGNLTKAAVGRFQIKQGIVTSSSDPGYGYVGPKTRAKINTLLGL